MLRHPGWGIPYYIEPRDRTKEVVNKTASISKETAADLQSVIDKLNTLELFVKNQDEYFGTAALSTKTVRRLIIELQKVRDILPVRHPAVPIESDCYGEVEADLYSRENLDAPATPTEQMPSNNKNDSANENEK